MPWKNMHVTTESCDKLLLKSKIFVWKALLYNNGSCLYKQKHGTVTGDNHSVSLANITVHYILQQIADILEQTELFHRFIDYLVWITDSESTNIGIRSALNTVFKNNGLERGSANTRPWPSTQKNCYWTVRNQSQISPKVTGTTDTRNTLRVPLNTMFLRGQSILLQQSKPISQKEKKIFIHVPFF